MSVTIKANGSNKRLVEMENISFLNHSVKTVTSANSKVSINVVNCLETGNMVYVTYLFHTTGAVEAEASLLSFPTSCSWNGYYVPLVADGGTVNGKMNGAKLCASQAIASDKYFKGQFVYPK